MKPMKPCITCGELIEGRAHCYSCHNTRQREREDKPRRSRKTSTARGYGANWKRLSLKARARQDWCTDCGSPDRLTVDHTPQAWDRYTKRLPIRLEDVDVVCSGCNTDRGSSRPGTPRFNYWVRTGIDHHGPWGDGVTGGPVDPPRQGTETVCWERFSL